MTPRSTGRRPSPRVDVELIIECADGKTSKALNETLMPDNRYFPKDQEFGSSVDGSSIRCTVRSPRVRPALSTVSSIISDAKLFADLWVEATARGFGRGARG